MFTFDENTPIRTILAHMMQGRNDASLCLSHGVLRNSSPLPDEIVRSQAGHCYASAGRLAFARPKEYTYCEGWAQSSAGIPLQHAWCLDRRGNVVDPTWAYHKGAQYLGVPIKVTALSNHLLKKRTWGFFTAGVPKAFSANPAAYIETNFFDETWDPS